MSESKFYVIRGDACPTCTGTGKVRNKFYDLWLASNVSPEIFWQRHRQSPADLKPEVDCPNCGGSGEVRSETTLTAALGELGFDVG